MASLLAPLFHLFPFCHFSRVELGVLKSSNSLKIPAGERTNKCPLISQLAHKLANNRVEFPTTSPLLDSST